MQRCEGCLEKTLNMVTSFDFWYSFAGFSLGRLHMGGGGKDLSPIWGTSAGGQSINGGTHEGGHRPYGGLTLIHVDYIIN